MILPLIRVFSRCDFWAPFEKRGDKFLSKVKGFKFEGFVVFAKLHHVS